jgi:hypothetical protein
MDVCKIGAVLCLFVICEYVITERSQAGQLQYSWSGKISPNGSDDPWLVGNQGKTFDLRVLVSNSASDLTTGNIEFAAFDAVDASLSIDGQPINYVGAGILDFTDDSSNLADLITFQGNFTQLGQTVEFGSFVALPKATFQFQGFSEAPPVFVSPAIVLDSSGCCGGTYATVVAAGTPVNVVPEPTTLALAASILILVRGCRVSTAHLHRNRKIRSSLPRQTRMSAPRFLG